MKKGFFEFLKKNLDIILAITLLIVIRYTDVFVPCVIKGHSMEPNYHDGHLAVASSLGKIERGDVVVATNPNGADIIKRVVGLPGETVECINGVIYINGKELIEDYIDQKNNVYPFDFKYEIGEDEIFLCGDNRDISLDNRTYGPIKQKDILGEIFLKL